MAKKIALPEELSVENPNMTPFIDVVFQLLIFFMLTLHFKQIEGQLVSHLPKDKGMSPSETPSVEEKEVRIVLCCDGNIKEHMENKGRHEGRPDADPAKDLPMKPKSGKQTWLVVESETIGVLRRSGDDPSKGIDLKSNAYMRDNYAAYRKAAERAAEMYRATPSSLDPTKGAPIKFDADSEVPYEHIVGILNELKRLKIENIEFTANPRLSSYYGPQK